MESTSKKNKKYTEQDVKNFIKEKGGDLISSYFGSKQKSLPLV